MRIHLTTVIFVPAVLLACSGFLFSQEPPASAPAPAPVNQPASPEEALAQLSHRIATIYRDMAEIAVSDPNRIGELKSQYARLAEEEEKAARAMQSMAAYHHTVSGTSPKPASQVTPKRANYGDSAFRR